MRKDLENSAGKLEGVFARGYGVVPKSVMTDASLSPEAKTLYAYYCIISGNDGGFQPSPREAVILRTLGMSHARFIRHRKALVEGGYILFHQPRRQEGKQYFETTRFLIVKTPRPMAPEELLPAEEASALPLSRLAAVQEGIFSDGFGLVPRMPVFDDTLTIEAKAAYIFLCIYANASTSSSRCASPSADLLHACLMGKSRVQRAMRELTEAGYIRRDKLHTGVYAGTCYTLLFEKAAPREAAPLQGAKNDTAKQSIQKTQNDTAEIASSPSFPAHISNEDTLFSDSSALQSRVIGQETENETTEKITAENETSGIDTAYINRGMENTRNTSTNYIINPSFDTGIREGKIESTMHNNPFDFYRREAASQIEASLLAREYGDEIIDCIVMILSDVYASREGTIRICGKTVDLCHVASVFRKARSMHIEELLHSLDMRCMDTVVNLQAYLCSCLYNIIMCSGVQRFKEACVQKRLRSG